MDRFNPLRRSGASGFGLLFGVLFFCASLTPSLVPRSPEMQGLLGGAVAAIGYALWAAVVRTWRWLDLPAPGARQQQVWGWVLAGVALATAATALWFAAEWQNSIRALWGMPPVETIAPFRVGGIAAAVFVALFLIGRSFLWLLARWARWLERFLPRRIALSLGFAGTALVFALLFDGVLFRGVLRMLDASALVADRLVPPELPRPVAPERTGSAASLVRWEDLGKWGRKHIAFGPTAADIGAFWDAPAKDPIRVHVGLAAASDPVERARLALAELKRVGGFDRRILVIAMPTGSGWLDPGSHDPLEYMHRGDIATVSVQYSYLNSMLSILVDPTLGLAEAQALFDAVYGHWTTLPKDARPRLYLHGLSLGAFLSQNTVPLLDVLGDPFHGALWTGSPFLSEFWLFVVARRQPGSPPWRPAFGNGSLIRSMNQDARFHGDPAPWGPMRLVLLQYASDPIVHFDYSLAFRAPDWLSGDRGPDVSPQIRWLPVITMLQVAIDMAVSLGVPGYGHDYIAEHYIPAWAETTEPEGWTPERQAALQALFAGRRVR
jgi:uncharacterized membrane protein